MKKIYILAVCLCVTMAFSVTTAVRADEETSSMMCDGGEVSIGDSQGDVQQNCGEPNDQSMDKWIYDFGPSEYYTVIFEEGKVKRILERH